MDDFMNALIKMSLRGVVILIYSSNPDKYSCRPHSC